MGFFFPVAFAGFVRAGAVFFATEFFLAGMAFRPSFPSVPSVLNKRWLLFYDLHQSSKCFASMAMLILLFAA
jgi:hypothetical protein